MLKSLGKGEGALNIIVWAGYAEDGSDDKTVDWVHPFEADRLQGQRQGRQHLRRDGDADEDRPVRRRLGVGRRHPAAHLRRRRRAGQHRLVPNYATISDFLKAKAWNSVGGQMYGIPHGWGANVLTWNPAKVTDAHRPRGPSCSTRDSPYKGKVTAYDSPIYIADAALYLKATKPDLKITNPYELDATQFEAAIDLLKQQKAIVGEYWADYTKAVSALECGNTVIGTEWQVNDNLVNAGKKAKVESMVPKEGVDRLVRHLDGLVQGQAPELHVPVDELDHLARDQRPGGRVFR